MAFRMCPKASDFFNFFNSYYTKNLGFRVFNGLGLRLLL